MSPTCKAVSMQGSSSNSTKALDIFTTICIENKLLCRVIGKGGKTIEEIQKNSGAKVIISQATDGNKTFAQIFGPTEGIRMAYRSINKLARDPSINKPVTIISPFKAKKKRQNGTRRTMANHKLQNT
ncbi:uncharacterized protein LOC143203865 [Rhynchophorus ferrugineus]|uniref:uncharacterized protein LOC143203865 n=1 Tax=Rhynchophorus ferrugineus TaxID=354439 RepID=UPI003FCE929E